jgi:hypothetical protein
MIAVLDLTNRATKRRFRIMRDVRTTAGIARRDVPTLDGADGLFLYGDSEGEVLARARRLVRDARNLIAVPQES